MGNLLYSIYSYGEKEIASVIDILVARDALVIFSLPFIASSRWLWSMIFLLLEV